MGAPTLNSQAKALVEAIKAAPYVQPDIVPPDWLTAVQLGKHIGCTPEHAAEMARRLGDRVEVRRFRVITGKRVFPVKHYRLK